MDETILVLTASTLADAGVERVCEALRASGRRVVEVDSARFPLETQVSVDLDRAVLHDGEAVELDRVSAVWHRHTDVAGALGEALDPTWRDAVVRQSELALAVLAADLPCLHVDHPDRTEAVPGSPGILRLGRAAGLDVPRTLVSNHPGRVRDFVRGCEGGAVRKLLHSSSIIIHTEAGDVRGSTEAVSPDDLADDSSIAACPMVWQERVPKLRELRVTAVGRRLFVASIDPRASAQGAVDWRQDPALVRAFEVDVLPPAVEAAVHRLLDRLRLNFATLDIIRTPEGRYVLLEVNTLSFFAFVEDATGLPISAELARLLAGEVPSRAP